MVRVLVCVIGLTLSACSRPPAAAEPAAETPIIAEAPVEPSAAEQRAAALVEDMQRKQAAFDREMAPAPRPVVTPPGSVDVAPPVTRAPIAAAAPPVVTEFGPVLFGEHDEPWWKGKMRDLDVVADDAVTRLAAAERAAEQQRLQVTYDRALAEVNARKAEAVNAKAAVERFREDARRANVPPGWLRWP